MTTVFLVFAPSLGFASFFSRAGSLSEIGVKPFCVTLLCCLKAVKKRVIQKHVVSYDRAFLLLLLLLLLLVLLGWPPRWGAADAEIKVPSGENTT